MRKNLFQIALESEAIPLGRELKVGFTPLLRRLIEKGPIQKSNTNPALEDLVENGYASSAVLNGPEEPEQVVATDKGLDLYNQIKTLDGFGETEEADTDAVDTETTNNDTEVANEGFVDWIKDLFTEKIDKSKLDVLGGSVDNINEFSRKNLRRKVFLDSWFFAEEDIISFFFRNNRVVEDIGKEIKEDISTLKLLKKSVENFNSILGVINFNSEEGSVRDIIDSKFNRGLIDDLHGSALLSGIVLSVNGKDRISRNSSLPDDFYDQYTVITSTVYGPDGQPIGQTETQVPTNKGRYEEYCYQANGAVKSNESLQSAFKQFSEFASEAEKAITEFYRNSERLKGTQTRATRGFLRNGQNISLTLYYIIRMYGRVAGRLSAVNKRNQEY